jgi:phosphate-selective porin OprO and OprP
MQYKKMVSIMALSGLISSPVIVFANDSTELEELRNLVQELDQKVKVLARKGEVAEEDAAATKKTTPIVKAGPSGFGFESADGKNIIKLRGLLQADYRSFQDGASDTRNRTNNRAGNLDANGFHDANDTALLRRIRPTIEGTLYGKYDFRFTPDFGNGNTQIIDAYIDARFKPYFKIRVGKYKSFVGLERLQSANDIKFVERSYVTNAILPNRDIGISVHGDVFGEKLNYALGVNNGVVDGGNISSGSEFEGNKEVTARLFATPFKDETSALAGLGLGIAGTFTNIDGERNLDFTNTSSADATRNGLPSYVTEGQQTFFRFGSASVANGKRTRITPQANYYYGPFGLLAEYARVSQDVSLLTSTTGNAPTVFIAGSSKKLNQDAWQIAASYLITGEDASFKGVKPNQDFDIDKGGWGAWELVARYSELNLDQDTFKNKVGNSFSAGTYANLSESAQSAKTWTAGVNWYLNQNAKVQLNYAHTKFDGGAGIGITAINAAGSNVRDRESEDALLARFQIAY